MKSLLYLLSSALLATTLHSEPLASVTLEQQTISALNLVSATATQQRVSDPITGTAQLTIDPTRTRAITSFFSGQVEQDLVQLGDQVEAGQTLSVLKSREVLEVLSNFMKADSRLETANLSYQRELGLLPKKLTTQDAFLGAQANYQEALANRNSALQTALLARSQDELRQLRDSDTIQDLTRLPITTPIAGTVIAKSVMAGEAVQTNAELFQIADLSQLLIEIQIPLKAASFVKVGDTLDFHTIIGSPRRGTAQVSRVSPMVNQSALSVSVFATLENADRDLLVGTPVNVDVVDSKVSKVTAVPSSALVKINGTPHLFIEDTSGQYRPIAITTGRSSQRFVEVTDGLPAEAKVVIQGASLLLAAWEERSAQ